MSVINFNTANWTLRQLLGNGLSYRVPRFQRDYSWTQEQWDDLWLDLEDVVRVGGEPVHYMGYLVLQTHDNKTFDVVDGQQRLTTLSLLTLAVLKSLQDLVEGGIDPDNNKRRIEQLRGTYIGYLDPVTLVPRSKLALNRNNDAYYTDYLVPLQKLPQRNRRASELLLRKAFEWLYKNVRETYGSKRDGAVLAKFIDDLADRLLFTVITVSDELNAFKVFETLNARGVRLSPTDLLKNHLFSVVSRETTDEQVIEILERRWGEMIGRLGGESFPDFLRVHWNSRNRFVRESELFKTIRNGVADKAAVFELLRLMEVDIDAYAALSNPDDALWTSGQRGHVRELRMFSVRQPWPLLLAAHRTFDSQGFEGLLRACSVISLRYNVIAGLATGEQERAYNGVALKIASGEIRDESAAVRGLAPIYVADEPFRAAFAEKALRTSAARNRLVVKYLLFGLERQLEGVEHDAESALYTVEHVLPQSSQDGWPEFTDEQIEDATDRLGNMTLLEADKNRDLGNEAFAGKRTAYERSCFALTRRIAEENDHWSPERIAQRQRWMAVQATAIWRISQLA